MSRAVTCLVPASEESDSHLERNKKSCKNSDKSLELFTPCHEYSMDTHIIIYKLVFFVVCQMITQITSK